ncbi:MAG: glycosyltransferase [Betaproteobacteria bacterium]|nr:glycosyltransferase [Betaproteobacteria bacterium]
MLVSILIRSLDRAALLSKALESVAAQEGIPLEVLVVAARPGHGPLPPQCGDHPLRLIPTDAPLHRSAAANRALDAARGELLLFLDDDDWLLPGHIARLADALQARPDAVAAYSDVQPVNKSGTPEGEPFALPFDALRLLAGNWIPPQGILFRRSLLERGCRVDEALDLYEDWDFWLQAAQFGPFVHVPGVSACYRIHDSSGVHRLEPFTNPTSLALYRKWLPRLADDQLAGLMQRVWQAPELQESLRQQQDENRKLAGQRAEALSSLSRQRAELTHTRELLGAREALIRQILASTSWRLTAPLRAGRVVVRALRRALRQPRWGLQMAREAWTTLASRGMQGLVNDLDRSVASALPLTYAQWCERYEVPPRQYGALRERAAAWKDAPLISVIMPTYNSDPALLEAALESVLSQVYARWELCVADDASDRPEVHELLQRYAARDERIRWVKRPVNGHISAASNSALALAGGDFVALLDHDDRLHPLALWFMAQAILTHPDAGLLYSDEDKLDADGQRCDPYFKCDFNPELMLAQNMVSHLGCYRRSLVAAVGGFREGFEGSQDYDLALRVIDHLQPQQIVHVPRVLYHWRMTPGSTSLAAEQKPYAQQSALRAVAEHLTRRGLTGDVLPCPEAPHLQRVRFALPEPAPHVTIIIPTRDRAELLSTCVDSIRQRSSYPHYDILVVDNGSSEPDALALLARLQAEGVRVLRDDSPFNFSALNNRAARQAQGTFLCLMNNDIEIVTPDWLEEMVSHAALPGIGAVGARLWYPNDTLQHCGVIIGLGGLAGHPHAGLPRGQSGYFGRAILQQSWSAVTAACLVIRKSTFDAVGGLDETLAVAFNDVDFCLKVRAAGYRNVWTPYAEMIHHESASRGAEDTPAKQRRFEGEVTLMQGRWADVIRHDPAYSPNLSLRSGNFDLAQPPRLPPVPPAP